MDRSGQVLLGKYELTRMLGKGGMGEVWEGEHQLTGRRVAVKILADAYLSNQKVMARFGREARAASAVQHDGIVEILDQDRTSEGVPFLVMEFLEGESVGQRIKRRKRLSENEALAIMLPLLDALDAAHRAGVIHRDLKPDNVFILPGVRGDEHIKILDFGISQKADEIEHRLTQEGSVLGTPHYMSPEQARGEANVDARADVYAAAVLLYECVVGQVPFDAGNYNALLQIIITRPPVPPRVRGAQISVALEQVIMAALAKRREERPPNARVLRELLLEAGMQGDATQLDSKTWKFRSVPQGTSLVPRDRKKPSAPTPHELEADLFKPARTTGSFALPRSSRHMEPAWTSRPVQANVASPAAAPAPVDLEAPVAPLTLDRQRESRVPELGAPIELAVPPRGAANNNARRVQPRARTSGPMKAAAPARSGIVRSLIGWLAVVGAIALLGYLASAVFTRPDARKHRREPEGTTTQPAQPR